MVWPFLAFFNIDKKYILIPVLLKSEQISSNLWNSKKNKRNLALLKLLMAEFGFFLIFWPGNPAFSLSSVQVSPTLFPHARANKEKLLLFCFNFPLSRSFLLPLFPLSFCSTLFLLSSVAVSYSYLSCSSFWSLLFLSMIEVSLTIQDRRLL